MAVYTEDFVGTGAAEYIISQEDQRLIDAMLRNDAKKAMETFFKNKRFYCGGKIPDHVLWTDENIDLVEKTSLEIAIEHFYKWVQFGVKINGGLARTPIDKSSDAIRLCIDLIHELEQLNITKGHYGGLLLLYLYICEGITNYSEV